MKENDMKKCLIYILIGFTLIILGGIITPHKTVIEKHYINTDEIVSKSAEPIILEKEIIKDCTCIGQKGETGISIKGDKGDKGDKGNIGAEGLSIIGPRGVMGLQGPIGATGNMPAGHWQKFCQDGENIWYSASDSWDCKTNRPDVITFWLWTQ